jgi:hypothetical protein
VIVSLAPFVEPESVTLLPPTSTTRPATVPVSPEVLPPEMPALNWVPVWATGAATLMSMRCPVLVLIVTPPPTPVSRTVPEV